MSINDIFTILSLISRWLLAILSGPKDNYSGEFKTNNNYYLWFVIKVLWKYCGHNYRIGEFDFTLQTFL